MAALELTTYPTNREDAAEDLYSHLMGGKFRNGVYKSYLNDFEVYGDSTGMQVKVRTGQVLIGGFDAELLTTQTITLADANASNPRIDRVVLRLDRDDPTTIYLDVLQGTAASVPAVPALTNTSTIVELPMAQIRVDAGVSSITPSKVTDERTYTAPRGTGSVTPGTITGTSGSLGDHPFPAAGNHSHGIDVVALQRLFVPAGIIWIAAFGATTPSGWLPCDGRLVSRSEYPFLRTYLGDVWGAGDGSTTFQVPNLTNYILRGAGGNQSIGQIRGSDTGTLTVAQLPLIDPLVDGDGGARIIVSHPTGAWGIPLWSGSGQRVSISDIDEFGNNEAHSVEQASKGVAFIIKAH